MTRLTQGLRVIAVISASAFSRGRRVLPRARWAKLLSEFCPASKTTVMSAAGAVAAAAQIAS
jgi:hypothetical protein